MILSDVAYRCIGLFYVNNLHFQKKVIPTWYQVGKWSVGID